MLIYINDNNIFTDRLDRNILNHLLIMSAIVNILNRDYSVPARPMGVGADFALLDVFKSNAGELPGITIQVIHIEIQRVLPIIVEYSNQMNVIYVGVVHGRIALTNQDVWEQPNGAGQILSFTA